MCFSKKSKKKKQQETSKIPKSELIHFEELVNDDDFKLTKLARQLVEGHPLILNLEKLTIDGANKTIAFLSGVVYAINGEISQIGSKIFLFADESVYDDGTVKKFLSLI